MQPDRPLLTIAIPTYNRSAFLAELLAVLAPQLPDEPFVELLISDNASPDDTPTVVSRFRDAGMKCKYLRNDVNIGADANFLECFREAAGKYVWIVGDDDIIVPGALRRIRRLLTEVEYDLVFVRPYGFEQRFDEKKVSDPFGRTALAIRNPRLFAEMTGVMLTFISAVIVNKERLKSISAPDPARLLGTNLIQLGWVLPLLAEYRIGLFVFGGLVAGKRDNSGGYDISKVFGSNLKTVTHDLLQPRQDLVERIVNNTLRCWFPDKVLEERKNTHPESELKDIHKFLKAIFGDNFRYWLFVFPAIKAPIWFVELLLYFHNRIILRMESGFRAIFQAVFLRKCYVSFDDD